MQNATTKEGETYLGKDLKFTFNSYINNTFDRRSYSDDVLKEAKKLRQTLQMEKDWIQNILNQAKKRQMNKLKNEREFINDLVNHFPEIREDVLDEDYTGY